MSRTFYRKIKIWLSSAPITIHIYLAYRINNVVLLKGRILQDRSIIHRPGDSLLRSFVNMIKRLLTDEKEDYEMVVILDNKHHSLKTDNEGYFDVEISDASSEFVVAEAKLAKMVRHRIDSLDRNAAYCVISDIDDTLLVTGVASLFKWRVLANTFFLNPWKRKSFEETNLLLHALNVGPKNANNPIFYISNSPWNLFYYLRDFLSHNSFPKGQLILRDIAFSIFRRKEIEKKHKYKEMYKLFELCKDLDFVLLGDSGEIDTDIYLSLSKKYPNRVKAIYIRDLPRSKRRNKVLELVDNTANAEVLLFQNSNQVINHARSKGLLN